MALSITTDKRYHPHWDDNRDKPAEEQISCKYRTMSVKDVMAIQTETGVNILTRQGGDEEDAFSTNWTVMQMVLVEYTSDWQNITVDGKAISDTRAVLDALSMHYLALFGEVFQFVLTASMGTDEDAKNFVPGSVQSDAESGTTAEDAPPSNSESATVEDGT